LINLENLRYQVRKRLTRPADYRASALRSWTVHPAAELAAPPALYVESELDLVKAVQHETTWENETRRIRGGLIHHDATRAWQFENIRAYGGDLYPGHLKCKLTAGPSPWLDDAPHQDIEEAALACSWIGNRYFGHAINDDLPLYLLASEYGTPFRTSPDPHLHQAEARELLNMPIQVYRNASFRKLIIFHDTGQNEHRIGRYQEMRRRVCARYKPRDLVGVMFYRGSSGAKRLLVNEEEVAMEVEALGFRVLRPSALTLDEILRSALGAGIILGVEGSQLCFGTLTAAAGGAILAIQPPQRFNNWLKDSADALGFRYGFTVGEPCEEGFLVSTDRLKRLIDMAVAAL